MKPSDLHHDHSPCLPESIHRAAHRGDLKKVLMWVCSAEGSPRALNEMGETVLAIAVRGLAGQDTAAAAPIIKALALAEVPLNTTDMGGRSALHWAVLNRPEAVGALLGAGANPNARGPGGNTPMHTLFMGGNPSFAVEIASLLRACGAEGSLKNDAGISADDLEALAVVSSPSSPKRLVSSSLPMAAASRARARCG